MLTFKTNNIDEKDENAIKPMLIVIAFIEQDGKKVIRYKLNQASHYFSAVFNTNNKDGEHILNTIYHLKPQLRLGKKTKRYCHIE